MTIPTECNKWCNKCVFHSYDAFGFSVHCRGKIVIIGNDHKKYECYIHNSSSPKKNTKTLKHKRMDELQDGINENQLEINRLKSM